MNLAAGNKDRAEKLAKQAADADRNQVFPLAVYTRVLYGNEKKDEAKATFEKLRAASAHPDLRETGIQEKDAFFDRTS